MDVVVVVVVVVAAVVVVVNSIETIIFALVAVVVGRTVCWSELEVSLSLLL